jgi:hypothetical protein
MPARLRGAGRNGFLLEIAGANPLAERPAGFVFFDEGRKIRGGYPIPPRQKWVG